MSLFLSIFCFIKNSYDIDIWYHLVVEYKKFYKENKMHINKTW